VGVGGTEGEDPGAVHEDVDAPAEGLGGPGCEVEGGVRIDEVGGHEDGRASSRPDGAGDGPAFLLVPAAHGDGSAGRGKGQSGRLADAARGPGDERSLPSEVVHGAS
jgi:hypothetical protein